MAQTNSSSDHHLLPGGGMEQRGARERGLVKTKVHPFFYNLKITILLQQLDQDWTVDVCPLVTL
jgi:hypothetical protein